VAKRISGAALFFPLVASLCGQELSVAYAGTEWVDQYNVAWTTQSKDSSESMPCGGRDIGLNVWVEKGELLFYMQRSGCFDENNEFLKLGRVRIALSPNPLAEGCTFRQELRLRDGAIYITAAHPDHGEVTMRVWVGGGRPIVHVDVATTRPTTLLAAYEGWRNQDVELPDDGKNSRFGCFGLDCYPGKVFRYKDTVGFDGDAVLWHHRNQNDKLIFDLAVEQQGLAAVKDRMWNPLKNRTFGGKLVGSDMAPAGTAEGKYILTPFRAWRLKSRKSATTHAVRVALHIDQAETLDGWQRGLGKWLAPQRPSSGPPWGLSRASWRWFWDRSHLVINPGRPDTKPWQLGRNYQLFRYQLGCNAHGDYPTKFNGGLFTYDPSLVHKRRRHAPDWRAWGGGSFTAQNQRLVYWPMLKSGDFVMMRPQFEYYRRPLENATLRVKTYWGHEGCLFTEQMSQFGLPIACAWGWGDPKARGRHRPKDFDRGVQVNGACIYHYEAQLEFSYMILEYQRFTGGDIAAYLPFIERSVRFFDDHYQMRCKQRTGKPLDENGKLVIYPSSSCESYKGATNPSDLIAGLNACLKSLLALRKPFTSPDKKRYWREFLARVPDYGTGEVKGDKVMKPAWSWKKYQNVECPQFYPLFPFNQFKLGDDAAIAMFRNTWKHGRFPKGMVQSWHQDGIFFARMGMAREAAAYNTKKMQDSGRRFPTFWGPGHDWVPDHNWGGSGMIGLQEMLLQTIGDEIRLLPAWPKDWDVDFKLHAPRQTVVEGKVRGGKLVELKVTPEGRRKDVVIAEAQ